MSDLVHWSGPPPELRDPLLLLALEGFVDAGEVGQTAAVFLRHRWTAEKIAELDGDTFIDYRARRPTAVVDSGQVKRVEWPRVEVFAARLEGPQDVVLMIGPEPDMRWHALTDAVEALCRRLQVARAVTLGAYPAAAPHTRPTVISQAGNGVDTEPVSGAQPVAGYTGPIGAVTALQGDLAGRGIPVLGLWAEVPHYIAASPNPPGALAMTRIVASLLQEDIDTTELEAAATLHREQVDEAVAEHEEAEEMIAGLERLSDSGSRDSDLPSGEDMAAEIERFLRSQD